MIGHCNDKWQKGCKNTRRSFKNVGSDISVPKLAWWKYRTKGADGFCQGTSSKNRNWKQNQIVLLMRASWHEKAPQLNAAGDCLLELQRQKCKQSYGLFPYKVLILLGLARGVSSAQLGFLHFHNKQGDLLEGLSLNWWTAWIEPRGWARFGPTPEKIHVCHGLAWSGTLSPLMGMQIGTKKCQLKNPNSGFIQEM